MESRWGFEEVSLIPGRWDHVNLLWLSAFCMWPVSSLGWCGCFSLTLLGVRFPESSKEEVQDQKQLLKDAAAFLLSCQIPGLVRSWGPAVMSPWKLASGLAALSKQWHSGVPASPPEQTLCSAGSRVVAPVVKGSDQWCKHKRGFPFPILDHDTISPPQFNKEFLALVINSYC